MALMREASPKGSRELRKEGCKLKGQINRRLGARHLILL